MPPKCKTCVSLLLQLVNEQKTRAILDMKWSSESRDKPLLAVTTSSGQLLVYQLEKSCLELKDSITINEELNPVVLSLDWNDRQCSLDLEKKRPHSSKLVTSDSSGHISIITFEDGHDMRLIDQRKNHDFEAWICSFDVWDSNVVYSGGDDCKLFMTDMREDSKKRV